MDFDLSENQSFLKAGAERFIADRHDFETWRKQAAAASGTDRALWARFGELGWLGLLVPEACGGLGWAMPDAAVLLEAFGAGMVTLPFLDAAVVGVRLLADSDGDSAMRDGLLAAIATGEALIVPALLEAGGRYRYGDPGVRARRDAAGGLVLSGGKILVPAGDGADGFLVTARLDGDLAILYAPADAPGVSRKGYRLLDGSWAADVRFAEVTVPAEALLAQGDAAEALLDRALDDAAVGVAALALGAVERVLDLTSEYLHARRQFGQPLAGFQTLQHRMADMFINAGMARSLLYGALSALGGSDAERSKAVSAARARMDRAGLEIGNMGIHLHGGMGMTVEYPVGHYYRRLVQLSRAYGDAEFHMERYERLAFAED